MVHEFKAGIFSGISNAEYHALPYFNKSGGDALEQSPLHYWAKYLDPDREPRVETPALALGNAIHCATLEPERFTKEYRRTPRTELFPAALVSADDYRSKCLELNLKPGKTKDEMKSQIKAANNRVVFLDDIVAEHVTKYRCLSEADFKTTIKVAEHFRKSPAAGVLFENGRAEQTIFWIDSETGVKCKARLDWITLDDILLDLKSAEDASPQEFGWACYKYAYHRQAAWYLDGYEAASGRKAKGFVFAVFEKKSPYACAFYEATPAMLEAGRLENRILLREYARCLELGEWPGYSEEIQPLDMPKKSTSRILERF